MNFEVKKAGEVKVVTRKQRTSKYEPIIKALTTLENGKEIVVNCDENQTADQLRQNLYQGLRNQEFDTATLKISTKEDGTGIVLSKEVTKK